MAVIKKASALLAELKRFLRFTQPTLDTSDNSLLRDAVLYPTAVAGEIIFTELQKVNDLQIIANLTGADLDNEATNWALERRTGLKATGEVVFLVDGFGSTDVNIPQGTIVSTGASGFGSGVRFTTTRRKFVPRLQLSAYYKRDTLRVEIPVPIEAYEAGTGGNIPTGKIGSILTPVTGATGVTNLSGTVGGIGKESDGSLRRRILKKMLGRDRNIRKGLESFVENEQNLFFDAKVVKPLDTDTDESGNRLGRPNGVDVYVIDRSIESDVQTSVVSSGGLRISLVQRPILSVISVVSQLSGAGTLVEDTDYTVHIDSTSMYRYSTMANDYIDILPAAVPKLIPDPATLPYDVLEITYNYASAIVAAQAILDSPEENNLNSNVMVKRAREYLVDIDADVTFFADITIADEKDRIRAALRERFDTLALGETVEKSDLITTIQNGFGSYPIFGVDQVVIRSVVATNEYGSITVEMDPATEDLTLAAHQYARLGVVSIQAVA